MPDPKDALPAALQVLTSERRKAFSAFVGDRRVVIADTNKTARAAIAKALVELGMKISNVVLASSYQMACEAIHSQCPDLVFADYSMEGHSGLELIAAQRKARQDTEQLLFILVTNNSTEAAVAEAAEGDVDAYILKPFTMELLQTYIVRAALDKITPGGYKGKLARGKELLYSGKLDEALEVFSQARELNRKPAMACYWQGQVYEKKGSLDISEMCYEEGLLFNEMHYRCSIALFDLYVQRDEPEKAYAVIKKLSERFPVSAPRLGKTIELAVRTRNYADIAGYYNVFTSLEDRREELNKYVCAALVVGAMYQLRQKQSEVALDLLRKASVTASDSPNLLREIVVLLLEHGLFDPAKAFLKRFPPEVQSGSVYLSTEYAVADRTLDLERVLVMGRQLVQNGVYDALIYRILIRRTVEAGFRDTADSLVRDASRRFPELAAEFTQAATGAR